MLSMIFYKFKMILNVILEILLIKTHIYTPTLESKHTSLILSNIASKNLGEYYIFPTRLHLNEQINGINQVCILYSVFYHTKLYRFQAALCTSESQNICS